MCVLCEAWNGLRKFIYPHICDTYIFIVNSVRGYDDDTISPEIKGKSFWFCVFVCVSVCVLSVEYNSNNNYNNNTKKQQKE